MPRPKKIQDSSPGQETVREDFTKSQSQVHAEARESRPSREAITRERVPFSSHTKKMDVFIHPESEIGRGGWHLHGFVSRGGRIERAKLAGYDFVYKHEIGVDDGVEARSHDLGDVVSWVSGTSEKGDAEVTYLMKIPREWWEKDQAQLQALNDETDSAIRRGAIGNQQKGYIRQGQDYDGHPQNM